MKNKYTKKTGGFAADLSIFYIKLLWGLELSDCPGLEPEGDSPVGGTVLAEQIQRHRP